jgi:NAD(P)-dependent dehydrogenase (short-subunit alcohol dehydrogenase family)
MNTKEMQQRGAGGGLDGMVALVTGGGGGLGAAICETLTAAGATVVAADLRRDLAEDVAERVERAGGRASALMLDVTDEDQCEEGIRRTVEQYGRLDALINNAGVDVTVPVEELSVDQWDRIIAVNLRAPFILSRLALPHMRRQRHGHIVNIISTAAKRAWPNAAGYHASKWGLLGLSHALHVEARPVGVKVTAVVSGGMRTPFLLERFPEIDPDVLQDPRTVAETVRFVLTMPEESVVPEVMVLPMRETSWP